ALYCAGRLGMETLRIDPATQLAGVRINVYTSIVVGLLAVAYLGVSARRRPGRETPAELRTSRAPVPAPTGVKSLGSW
ncbi:MAG: hypothetical protein WCF36_16375, partial [Candidatus Nanopelagicales bacterium]